jgi:diadenylate cyclase
MEKEIIKKGIDFSTFLNQYQEMDTKRQEFLTMISLVAPGTPLRQGINYIVQAQSGALIIIGNIEDKSLFEIGFTEDTNYTPHKLYELAKMDGAIIMDSDISIIKYSNTHLHPHTKIASLETGARHRVAERFAIQTGAISIAISQKRNTVTIYFKKNKYILRNLPEIMSACAQALQTFDNYKNGVKKLMDELTIREFRDTVQFLDLIEIIKVIETLRKVENDVERYVIELGIEGVLLDMRFKEMKSEISDYWYIVDSWLPCINFYTEIAFNHSTKVS